MVHTYTLLHVVTYMTRIGYNALFIPLIAKAAWFSGYRVGLQIQGADGSNHDVGSYFFIFIEKFTEYFQAFIYIFAKLSLCIFVSSQEKACIYRVWSIT